MSYRDLRCPDLRPPDLRSREHNDGRPAPRADWRPGMTVRTPGDLPLMWQTLIMTGRGEQCGRHGHDPGDDPGAAAFEPSGRTLWLAFLDCEDRSQPTVFPIDGVPAEPEPAMVSALGDIVRSLVADDLAVSVPVLLARPGPAEMTEADRRWARAVRTAFGPAARRWPVHLASRGGIRAFAPDDLIEPAS